MKKLSLIFITLIFLSCCCSTANEILHSIDKTERECISKTADTHFMNQCSNAAQNAWEKEIKKTLLQLKAVLDKESYKSLINAQKDWEKYKINEFVAINKMLKDKQGTMYLNVDTGLKVDIVRQRALKLQEYLKTIID